MPLFEGKVTIGDTTFFHFYDSKDELSLLQVFLGCVLSENHLEFLEGYKSVPG